MKSFLEEYGFAILAAIVVILLIAMSTPVGNLIKAQILGMVDKFANTADKKLDASASGEFSAMIVNKQLIITGPSDTNQYSLVFHGVEGGKDVDHDVVVDADVDLNNSPDSKEGYSTTKAAAGINLSTLITAVDAGSQYYVTITNVGTGETFQSNIAVK